MRSRALWMFGLALLLAVAAVFLAQNWLQKQTKPEPMLANRFHPFTPYAH